MVCSVSNGSRFSATDLRASRASSETACLPTPRPRNSAANIGKSSIKLESDLSQFWVNLCVIVCVYRLGGGGFTADNLRNLHITGTTRAYCLGNRSINLQNYVDIKHIFTVTWSIFEKSRNIGRPRRPSTEGLFCLKMNVVLKSKVRLNFYLCQQQ